MTKQNDQPPAMKEGRRNNANDLKRIQGIHDSACELGAMCQPDRENASRTAQANGKSFSDALTSIKSLSGVVVETWDIANACQVLAQVAGLLSSELAQEEPDDARMLVSLANGLCKFIAGEVAEIAESITAQEQAEAAAASTAMPAMMSAPETVPPDAPAPEAKSAEPPKDDNAQRAPLNFSYIKRLHLPKDDEYFADVLAVKSIGDGVIRGYLALWGDENTVDVESDFFTGSTQKGIALPPTDFWDGTLGLPRSLTWDHAQDPTTKGAPVIGQIVEMGDDEVGRWYSAQLDRNYKYRKAIDALISKRAVGTSSDSAPQYVVRERTKSGANWIKQWPLFAAALTTTPCEPRMLDVGSPFWKSIGLDPASIQPRTGQALEAQIAELTRRHDALKQFSGRGLK